MYRIQVSGTFLVHFRLSFTSWFRIRIHITVFRGGNCHGQILVLIFQKGLSSSNRYNILVPVQSTSEFFRYNHPCCLPKYFPPSPLHLRQSSF